jgi:hypothetical protein
MSEINFPLLTKLAAKPHKHLNIVAAGRYGVMVDGVFDTGNDGIGEVMEEARAVQHLCDLAGISEGLGYSAHIDARVYLLLVDRMQLRERLDRIATWHSRESGPGGMVGDYCTECGERWPCDTRRMADGTHEDLAPAALDGGQPATEEDHFTDWIGFVEEDDEYAARCSCGYRVTAWAEDAAEESLQRHIDDPRPATEETP